MGGITDEMGREQGERPRGSSVRKEKVQRMGGGARKQWRFETLVCSRQYLWHFIAQVTVGTASAIPSELPVMITFRVLVKNTQLRVGLVIGNAASTRSVWQPGHHSKVWDSEPHRVAH